MAPACPVGAIPLNAPLRSSGHVSQKSQRQPCGRTDLKAIGADPRSPFILTVKIVQNTLANLAASLLAPLLAIVLTPFYIQHLGIEGYGLVGFFTALHILLGIVSAAMGKVYLREVSARTVLPERRESVPLLFKWFLVFFLVWGAVVAIGIALLSWWISHRWVHLDHLDPATVQACILLIAVTLAATVPTSVCVNTLFGLQEHVRANALSIVLYLLTTAVAVVLVYFQHSVLAYYAATAGGAVLAFFFIARLAARQLRSHLGNAVVWPTLRQTLRERHDPLQVIRDSLLLLWTEGVGVIVTQSDRLLLTALLPLSSLGIYNVGGSIGRLVQVACSPYLTAAFPRLCQLATTDSAAAARHAFRQQAIVLVLVASFAMPVCIIPHSLLVLWLGNTEVAARATDVAALFAIAYGCLALSGAPYNLTVAAGRTRPIAIYNATAIVWYPLLGYWLISHFGLTGAAVLWLTYCATSLIVCTLVAWRNVDRAYFSLRESARTLAILPCAGIVAVMVKAAPLLGNVARAAIGSALILVAGFCLVLGRAEIARLLGRSFKGLTPPALPPST